MPFLFQRRFGSSWALAGLVLLALFCSESANSQSVDAESWRSKTIGGLVGQIEKQIEKSPGRDVGELEAQKRWLSKWRPGEMQAKSIANGVNVAVKRIEPNLNSDASALIQQAINEAAGVCSDRQVYARLNCIACQNPSDAAAIQALLFWMDDNPARRKEFLPEIETATERLICLLRQSIRCCPNAECKLSLEFALYRRARALAYRELPSVVAERAIGDPKRLSRQIQMAYEQLVAEAGGERTEFILLEIRMLRRADQHGRALRLLEEYGGTILPKWYQKKRRDILQALDWQLPGEEAAEIFLKNFPKDVAVESNLVGQEN